MSAELDTASALLVGFIQKLESCLASIGMEWRVAQKAALIEKAECRRDCDSTLMHCRWYRAIPAIPPACHHYFVGGQKMAKSLSRIMVQIERLQKEAAEIQATVIDRVRKEIAQHGLTVEQLFGNASAPVASGRARATKSKSVVAKFADGAGNTWGGRGNRPDWLRQALAAGKALEDFLVGAVAVAAETKPARRKPATRRVASVKAVEAPARKTATRKAAAAKKATAKKATAPSAKKALAGRKPRAKPAAAARKRRASAAPASEAAAA